MSKNLHTIVQLFYYEIRMRSMDLKFRSGVPVPKLVFFRASGCPILFLNGSLWQKEGSKKFVLLIVLPAKLLCVYVTVKNVSRSSQMIQSHIYRSKVYVPPVWLWIGSKKYKGNEFTLWLLKSITRRNIESNTFHSLFLWKILGIRGRSAKWGCCHFQHLYLHSNWLSNSQISMNFCISDCCDFSYQILEAVLNMTILKQFRFRYQPLKAQI